MMVVCKKRIVGVNKTISKAKLKPYWDSLQLLEDVHFAEVDRLEKEMNKELDESGLFFFWSDGYCGIGNDERTMKLVQFE